MTSEHIQKALDLFASRKSLYKVLLAKGIANLKEFKRYFDVSKNYFEVDVIEVSEAEIKFIIFGFNIKTILEVDAAFSKGFITSYLVLETLDGKIVREKAAQLSYDNRGYLENDDLGYPSHFLDIVEYICKRNENLPLVKSAPN